MTNSDNTKLIQLTQGKFAIVDAEDYEWLSQWKWYFMKGYAVRNAQPKIMMHRIINNTPDGMDTDHINGKKLDNRRANLRTATRMQNQVCRPKQINNTSGYKCVSFHKRIGKWFSYIVINKKMLHIGYFDTKEDAAIAYNSRAIKEFGDFAHINIII